MAVLRINKTKDYTVMSNAHFKEKEMSLKAKGLLSQMLSLPENWDYSIAGLVAINKENESSIKSALNELKKFGYLVVTKKMPNETTTGRIEYVYDIYEQPHNKQPIEKQQQEKQAVENLPLENQAVENQGQLSTNELSTNELNTKRLNTKQIEKEFNTLWEAYPRKQGKANAFKAYEKARKNGVEFQTVLDGVYLYAAYLKRNKVEDRFIKQGSTWFNQQCWNDEYTSGSVPTERDEELDAIF
jgi:predicted transcriptional regulator